MAESNTGSNTRPTPMELAMARAQKVGWHVNGGWCRKFPGDKSRTYFGRVPVAEAIRLNTLEEERRRRGVELDHQAESKMRTLRLGDAVNLYLNHLDAEHARGEIGAEQRASFGDELERLTKTLGRFTRLADLCKMTAPDTIFRPLREAAVARGLAAGEKHISQVRTFLKWCTETRRFMPPPFYGGAFDAPGEKEKRARKKADRKAKGVATWEPAEVLELIEAARATDVHRYAQVLLMVNGGMGATDLSLLEDADVDWDRRCIHTDRSKTLVPRVVPLWNMTVEAMKVSRAARAHPADPAHAGLFFLTRRGRPLVTRALSDDGKRVHGTDAVKNWFYAVLNAADADKPKGKIPRLRHLKRHRAGGYTLRSVFATLAKGHPGNDPDLPAIIMGHKLEQEVMEFYLRGDLRAKLSVVTEHVKSQIWR